MFRKSQQVKNDKIKIKMKNKTNQRMSQYEQSNEIRLKLILSKSQSTILMIPKSCSMKNLNQILQKKIKQLQYVQPLGYQIIPKDYAFDYKLKVNTGEIQNKNMTLKCLFKNEQLQKYINKQNIENSKQSYYKINQYKICHPLSSGGFSRVYLVRSLLDGNFYAAKFMDKKSKVNIDRAQTIRNQFNIHKSLKHPFIVKMYEYIQTSQFYILILQYCPGGQLFNLLKNNRFMKQEKARIIFLQVLMAIKYLHNQNIIYRDIKPQNILIDSDGNAKLADFGLAKQIRQRTNSYCGSVEYMAPQIINKQIYSFDVDLYCMGALLFQILIGCPPFYNPNFSSDQTKYHIANTQVSFPMKIILSDQVKDLMLGLLQKNPQLRYGNLQGVDQILNHPWIQQVNINQLMKKQISNPFVPDIQSLFFQDLTHDVEQQIFRKRIIKQIKFYQTFYFKKDQDLTRKSRKQFKSLSVSFFDKYRNQSMYTKQTKGHNYNNSYEHNFYNIPSQFNLGHYCQTKQVKKRHKFNEVEEDQQKINFRGFSLKKRSQSKKLNRSLSRQTYPSQQKNNLCFTLLVNSKSEKKRNNSQLKNFAKNINENKTNKLQFMKPTKSKKVIFSSKYNINSKGQSTKFIQQESLNRNEQKQNINQKILVNKMKDTQNKKELKKKNLGNKKKFIFSSMPKNNIE